MRAANSQGSGLSGAGGSHSACEQATVDWGTCPCVKEGQPWASVLGITSDTRDTNLIQNLARTNDGIYIDSVTISRHGGRQGENSDSTWHLAAIATATSYTCEASDKANQTTAKVEIDICLLYTSPSPRDATLSRMPSSA